MGRSISGEFSSSNTFNVPTTTGTKVVGAGYMGEFGTGLWKIFQASGTFTVPDGITSIRVRVVGGGGGGSPNNYSGGGGGYAHGVFQVTSGSSYSVTVGAAGLVSSSGGTSSFGALISATGGEGRATSVTHTGGIGIGGDFQASGGSAINMINGGGGAAGSQLGNGGNGFLGGGGVGGNSGLGYGGASAFASSFGTEGAENISGQRSTTTTAPNHNPINATIRFPFDCFTGAGGVGNVKAESYYGGTGAGGGGTIASTYSGVGGVGGGMGATPISVDPNKPQGIGGGGAYDHVGGQGLVIVEF